MWCLPTHKRPEKLKRLIDSVSIEDFREEVLVMVWGGDPRLDDYCKMDFPKSWMLYIGKEQFCRDKLNKAFVVFPHEKFYGLLTDDIVLATPGILTKLRQGAESGKFVWPDDGQWHEKLATHPVVPGNFLRALGFWAHSDFPHNGIDSVLFIMAKELGILQYMPECKITVLHPLFGTAAMDETYEDGKKLNEQFSFTYDLFLRTKLYPLLKQTAQRLEVGYE